MLDRKGFDNWAQDYEEDIMNAAESDGYPFAGYWDIMDHIYQTIMKKPSCAVLELGFGTGMLASRLYDNGCLICGQDFSEKMIERAQLKMPRARLYQGDLADGLAEELQKHRYDFIVSTYCLHHLTDDQKVILLSRLLELLKPEGRIIIGDVAFESEADRERCALQAGEEWDDEEYYFVAERMRRFFPQITFRAVSECGAILTLGN
ncbi:MAG: methyltransferase domain-containing protein [Erysipelotrichaceae bacterium]|nr:methyltransferase domain-containing protein [Erysipelotrichaceae bacterium]